MSDKTGIEWTDATWNPTTGCDKVSPGCDHCYAMTLAPRLKAMGSPRYQKDGDPKTSGPGFGLTVHPTALDQPLKWKRPRRIFVNSMSDLFHKDVPDDFIAKVFAVMAASPRHTFQVLTKRPGRMKSLLTDKCRCGQGHADGIHFRSKMSDLVRQIAPDLSGPVYRAGWPLPNVWLGTSVEDQKWADVRIPLLLDTPAAVRFLSMEPLLAPVTFRWAKWAPLVNAGHLDGLTGIDWVIVGGESGRGARPMHPDWARTLRDQCAAAGVPFLFKQWGSHDEHGQRMSKHDAGRTLDGRTWDEYPERVG